MTSFIKLLKLFFSAVLLAGVKILSYKLSINNFPLFFMTEIIFFFIFSAILLYITDESFEKEQEKLKNAVLYAAVFAACGGLFTLFKEYIPAFLINYLLFAAVGILPFLRDYYAYTCTEKRFVYRGIITAGALVLYKLFFNLINYYHPETSFAFRVMTVALVPFFFFAVRSVVYGFFVNGVVEYEGREFYIFESLKAGKKGRFHICADDIDAPKNRFFTITAKDKKLFVSPGFALKIENRAVTVKAEIEDGDTIKAGNGYFTVTKHCGHPVKRFFVLFLSLFMMVGGVWSTEFSDENADLLFTDLSAYPQVRLYADYYGDSQGMNHRGVFVSEGDSSVSPKKISVTGDFSIDLYLILDVTGNMVDRYAGFTKYAERIFTEVAAQGKTIRIGVVTFADEKNDMQHFPLVDNYQQFSGMIRKLHSLSGNDFKENPLDALMSIDTSTFKKNALRCVILFTDAPPHLRGDRGKDGVLDFTDKTVSDAVQFVENNDILLFTASFERYTEYRPFYADTPKRFFDIENVENTGTVLYSVTAILSHTICAEYQSGRSRKYLQDNIIIFTGDDAAIQKKLYGINKIKKRSFSRSLFDIF